MCFTIKIENSPLKEQKNKETKTFPRYCKKTDFLQGNI